MFCFECIKRSEIVNKFLLAGDKFMPEIHLKQPGFTVLVVRLLKTKKELKNLCRQEIQILFIKMSLTKLVFNMIWLMVNQKIQQEELDQAKFLRDKAFKIDQ